MASWKARHDAFRVVHQIIVSGLAEMGGMQFRSGMSPRLCTPYGWFVHPGTRIENTSHAFELPFRVTDIPLQEVPREWQYVLHLLPAIYPS